MDSKFITQTLNIQHPLIQAPMLGVSTPEMVAAVSGSGGLGSLPIGGLSPQLSRELIRKTKELTSKPFAVNFFAHDVPKITEELIAQASASVNYLSELARRHGLNCSSAALPKMSFVSYRDQIDVLIDERVSVVSFTFGIPDDDVIHRLKSKGVILIGTCTSVAEAAALERAGVDFLCAQGAEAGGHQGSFLNNQLESPAQIGLCSLLGAVVSATSLPVIAAGGIYNRSTYQSAVASGACAVQVGSHFIKSDESAAHPAYKQAVASAQPSDMVLTRSFTGRWARGVSNLFIKEMENAPVRVPEYPVQNLLTQEIRKQAMAENNPNFMSMWGGKNAHHAPEGGAAQIYKSLIQTLGL